MDTLWTLLCRYQKPLIPAEEVCADFFAPLTFKAWKEQVSEGSIPLPLVRMTESRKAPLYVSINALAAYIDDRCRMAERERDALCS